MGIFLYGTLLHRPLLDLVAGEVLEAEPATLPGYAVHWVKDASYPIILERPEAETSGWIVRPSETARARMGFYEEAFDYILEPATVTGSNGTEVAKIYRPPGALPPLGPLFDISAWADAWAPLTLAAAREVMEEFGVRPPAMSGSASR